mmetsp:Transcript_24090/g.60668  ORF Transcript_24090/g.60668 Transcript_24090/m.60668 type:complete len:220 (-) Transcript_24090:490-1149(-)
MYVRAQQAAPIRPRGGHWDAGAVVPLPSSQRESIWRHFLRSRPADASATTRLLRMVMRTSGVDGRPPWKEACRAVAAIDIAPRRGAAHLPRFPPPFFLPVPPPTARVNPGLQNVLAYCFSSDSCVVTATPWGTHTRNTARPCSPADTQPRPAIAMSPLDFVQLSPATATSCGSRRPIASTRSRSVGGTSMSPACLPHSAPAPSVRPRWVDSSSLAQMVR